MKFSAHTELKGVIVFDPIILNEPESVGVVVVGVVVVVVGVVVVLALQPAKVKTITSTSARDKSHFLTDCNNLFSLFYLSFLVVY
jgi:hypothetical protein